jgi:hypothetical protein
MIEKVDLKRVKKLLSIAGNNIQNPHIRLCSDNMVLSYLNLWAKSKYDYYLLFNQNLSIHKEVECEISVEDFAGLLETFKSKYLCYHELLNDFSNAEYFDNQIQRSHRIGDYLSCPINAKLTKIFSLIFNEKSSDRLFKTRDEMLIGDLSLLMSQKYTKGSIYISIDPYDYLTSSVNQSGWKSCHSIIDGLFGTASLSYMLDKSSLVCFRPTNEGDVKYSFQDPYISFVGNSKRWRQMLYFDKHTCSMVFSRPYPSDHQQLTDHIRYFMEEHISNFLGQENMWIKKNYCDIPFGGCEDTYYDDAHNVAYNIIMVKPKQIQKRDIKFSVGSDYMCVYCGDMFVVKQRKACCDNCKE